MMGGRRRRENGESKFDLTGSDLNFGKPLKIVLGDPPFAMCRILYLWYLDIEPFMLLSAGIFCR